MNASQVILLIEDDHDIRVAFRQTLEQCGYFVCSAANGWDALDLLSKTSTPKLIILDLSMPIMSGEEFLKLKEENPRFKEIPVLLVSSHLDRLEKLGHPFLKKPVDMEEFRKVVAKYFTDPETKP